MQKLINLMAVTSFIVSGCVVAGGVYVYQNKDSLIDEAKTQVTDAVKDLLGASQLGSALIGGEDVDDVTDEALGAETAVPLPVDPF